MDVNPYEPSDETPEGEPSTSDPPANGCAIAFAFFGLGGTAALMLCFPLLRPSTVIGRRNFDLTDGFALLLFGVCWLGAAICARQMHVFASLALAMAGIALFVGIGTYGRFP